MLWLQVGRVFPELRATVQYLWENRRIWNERYIEDIEADAFKTPAEKAADRVSPSACQMPLCSFPCCPSAVTLDVTFVDMSLAVCHTRFTLEPADPQPLC